MTKLPDQRRELLPTPDQTYPNLTPGKGKLHEQLFSGFAGRRSDQNQTTARGKLPTNLPVLAPQRAAADIYRQTYRIPDTEPGKVTGKAKAAPDQAVKPAVAPMQPDVSQGREVRLKKRKVNANRFRARTNKPANW